MRLKYAYTGTAGSVVYSFNANTTAMQIGLQIGYDGRGRLDQEKQTWQVTTTVQTTEITIAAAQVDLTSKISAVVSAMNNANGTLTLYNDNGTTKSYHEVTNCRTSDFSFPSGVGAQYANQRTIVITVNGYSDEVKTDKIIEFNETIQFSGGGGRYVVLETISSAPSRFQQNASTVYRATQSGNAVGRDSYPTVPEPKFAVALLEQNPQILKSHRYTQTGEERYSISWSYSFASPTALENTDPNKWIPTVTVTT